MPRSRQLLFALALIGGACSAGDGTDIGVAPTSGEPAEPANGATVPDPPPGTLPDTPPGDTPPSGASDATVIMPTFPEVAETGVPGLDSDDAFCAAWSRFGGSFQVVAVNAAFGDGSMADRAFVEVVAGPTVTAAIGDLSTAWPDEIASEADAALHGVFGPFATRVGAAEEALVAAGATPDDLAVLSSAWLGFLAARDPSDPTVTLELDDELSSLVVAAVPGYLAAVGPWDEDESLVTDAPIPLTEAYLAATCPDQGALAGQEVT